MSRWSIPMRRRRTVRYSIARASCPRSEALRRRPRAPAERPTRRVSSRQTRMRGPVTLARAPIARGGEKTAGRVRLIGIGVFTGADDDPSAIGTYASAGAQFGLAFLWIAPVLLVTTRFGSRSPP